MTQPTDPIEPALLDQMRDVGRALEIIFNGPKHPDKPPRIRFALFVSDAEGGPVCNHITNIANRATLHEMLVDQAKRIQDALGVEVSTHM